MVAAVAGRRPDAQNAGLVTIRITIRTISTVRSIPPCWSFLPVAAISGGGPAGRRRRAGRHVRRQLDHLLGVRAWTKRAKPSAIRYRMIPTTSQR